MRDAPYLAYSETASPHRSPAHGGTANRLICSHTTRSWNRKGCRGACCRCADYRVCRYWAYHRGSAVVLIIQVVNMVLAPVRMNATVMRNLDEVLASVQLLEVDRTPKILASPKTGQHRAGVGYHLMWTELEVQNTSTTKPLRDTQVRILDCEHIASDHEKGGLFHNLGHSLSDWTPMALRCEELDTISMDIPGGVSRRLWLPIRIIPTRHLECSMIPVAHRYTWSPRSRLRFPALTQRHGVESSSLNATRTI